MINTRIPYNQSSFAIFKDSGVLVYDIEYHNHITNNNDFYFAQINNNGQIDTAFGSNGIAITDIASGSDNNVLNATFQSDGRMVVTGSIAYGEALVVARYNIDGTLDTSFASSGALVSAPFTDMYANLVSIQTDGKILIGGLACYADYNYFTFVSRLNIDGSIDTSFGSAGKAYVPSCGYTSGMTLQSDGKILVTGAYGPYGGDQAIARLNANGSLDASFGSGGIVHTSFSGRDGLACQAKVLSDGKIVTLGLLNSLDYSDTDITLVRYNANGSIDTTFGTNGKVINNLGITSEDPVDLVIQADGKIIVAANTGSIGTFNVSDIALIRYNPNGSLDNTFGINGVVISNLGSNHDYISDISLQSDGKILVAGGSGGECVLLRFNTDGTVDQTYGSADATITGTTGNDKLTGGLDGDIIEGLTGHDTLDGGAGADSMTGGLGNDVYIIDNVGDIVTELKGQGSDRIESSITYSLADTDGAGIDGGNVEKLTLTGTDVINGTGNGLANVLTGNTAANALSGEGANDTLSGGSGNDTITGGTGNDSLTGGSGNDTLVFNAVVGFSSDSGRVAVAGTVTDVGQDKLNGFNLAGDTIKVVATNVSRFVHGTDTAIGTAIGTQDTGVQGDFTALTGLIELNQVTNDNWSDNGDIALTFISPSVALTEANFEARLQYQLTGTSAANTLTGGVLADTLIGGGGNDRLNGGEGKDVLTGGTGSDIFVFSSAIGTNKTPIFDTITDYDAGDVPDSIRLDDDIFTSLGVIGTTAGVVLASGAFNTGATATEADDRIIYNNGTGKLYYDADGSGAGTQVLFALMGTTTHPTLSASDFLIIA